jgi:methionyl-tRNA formyltransferase
MHQSSQPNDLTSLQTKFVFFGTDPLAKDILDTLKSGGYLPALIVAGQDTLDNKKNIILPTEKVWAQENNIEVFQPEKLTSEVIQKLSTYNADVFIVASYGKILPNTLLALPKHGVLNVHPSLLPILRGPSPMRSAILNDIRDTGVSVMLLDDKMDHGPILAQKKVSVAPWPERGSIVDKTLSKVGAELLLEVLPKWIAGTIVPVEQDHSNATYCKEFEKKDGLIDLSGDAYKNYLKICAFDGWPGTYFFVSHNGRDIRVKITQAEFIDNKLVIKKVIPEGKKEMLYTDFLKGIK